MKTEEYQRRACELSMAYGCLEEWHKAEFWSGMSCLSMLPPDVDVPAAIARRVEETETELKAVLRDLRKEFSQMSSAEQLRHTKAGGMLGIQL